ncbi:hypothetical protein EHQ90_22390 [Leptospira stimsonii]|uniref:Uncharacterized protein n=1 Tax=Leptospira stimsonii TaxID=2202203 RepID=A0ABY2MUJ8_9LEPT|nr:hypothetical protein [Leptospira stimsonii]TGM08428.1 hypothetical protein EHQ90_22390 [Leptospira stimsonii]
MEEQLGFYRSYDKRGYKNHSLSRRAFIRTSHKHCENLIKPILQVRVTVADRLNPFRGIYTNFV